MRGTIKTCELKQLFRSQEQSTNSDVRDSVFIDWKIFVVKYFHKIPIRISGLLKKFAPSDHISVIM